MLEIANINMPSFASSALNAMLCDLSLQSG